MKAKISTFILAGIPHILYASSLYLPHLINTSQNFFIPWWPVTRSFWIILALGVGFAWRQGWPRWSGSWLGYLLVLVIDQLVSLFPEGFLAGVAIILFFILSWLLIYRLAQIDPIQSLLVIPSSSLLWLWYVSLASVHGLFTQGMIFLWCGIVLGITAGFIERQQRVASALAWVIGAVIVAGLPVAVGEIYINNLAAASAPAPTTWNVIIRLATDFLLPALLGLPLWLILFLRKTSKN